MLGVGQVVLRNMLVEPHGARTLPFAVQLLVIPGPLHAVHAWKTHRIADIIALSDLLKGRVLVLLLLRSVGLIVAVLAVPTTSTATTATTTPVLPTSFIAFLSESATTMVVMLAIVAPTTTLATTPTTTSTTTAGCRDVGTANDGADGAVGAQDAVAAAAAAADHHARLHQVGELDGAAAGAALVQPPVLLLHDVAPALVLDVGAGHAERRHQLRPRRRVLAHRVRRDPRRLRTRAQHRRAGVPARVPEVLHETHLFFLSFFFSSLFSTFEEEVKKARLGVEVLRTVVSKLWYQGMLKARDGYAVVRLCC